MLPLVVARVCFALVPVALGKEIGESAGSFFGMTFAIRSKWVTLAFLGTMKPRFSLVRHDLRYTRSYVVLLYRYHIKGFWYVIDYY